MSRASGPSYLDHLDQGEVLHRSVEDVCTRMEALGWVVNERRARGFRYWCPCSRQHSVWVSTAPMTYERLDYLLKKTCLTFE